VTSAKTERAAWRRRRTEKRSEARAKRTAAHELEVRRMGAARGAKGLAEAEWNIFRAKIADLPEPVREERWRRLATLLRQVSDTLPSRHPR
jgi:hypothetical protein